MNISILPVQVKFFDYFQAATANLLAAATMLEKLLNDYHDVDDIVEQINELEHKGDVMVHDVTNLLPRTLITPFDSEDIRGLIDAIDNALDAIHSAASCLSIYQITEVKKPAARMAHLIVEGATELEIAVKGLQDKSSYAEAKKHVVHINTIENSTDRLLEEGVRSLVAHPDEIFDFLRWKEIFEMLEQATDRLEDAGDVIERVMISNA
jgi:uncharacterized protein